MRRQLGKQIGLHVSEGAYQLLTELAVEDDRTTTGMARRILLDRLNEIAAEREQSAVGGEPPTTSSTNTSAAA